jgi:hypothetical protein
MNRYLQAVLTIIAVELGWIAVNHSGVPVSAQQKAMPVIITGMELPRDYALPVALRNVSLRDRNEFVPVAVLGQTIGTDRVRFAPIDIRAAQPVPIEAHRPIEVRIPVTSSPRPGE